MDCEGVYEIKDGRMELKDHWILKGAYEIKDNRILRMDRKYCTNIKILSTIQRKKSLYVNILYELRHKHKYLK